MSAVRLQSLIFVERIGIQRTYPSRITGEFLRLSTCSSLNQRQFLTLSPKFRGPVSSCASSPHVQPRPGGSCRYSFRTAAIHGLPCALLGLPAATSAHNWIELQLPIPYEESLRYARDQHIDGRLHNGYQELVESNCTGTTRPFR